MSGGLAPYNLGFLIKFARLNLPVLSRCIYDSICRHEILSATIKIRDGQPVQIIDSGLNPSILIEDLRDLPTTARSLRAYQLIAEENSRPFNLATGPLFRVQLLRLANDENWLQVVMHHVISDGWSLNVLNNEIRALYSAYVDFRRPELPPLAIQYGDFADWQRGWLRGEELDKQLAYWKAELKGTQGLLSFPRSRPRPAKFSYKGQSQFFRISPSVLKRLRAIGQRMDGTLFVTLLATFKVLLYKYTKSLDLVVGTPVANRTSPELEPLIGLFVNTLPIRTQIKPRESFIQFLQTVRSKVVAAQDHQDIPFEKLVSELQPARSLSHNPLLQVIFSLEVGSPDSYQGGLGELNLTWEQQSESDESCVISGIHEGSAKFDLTILLNETNDNLIGVCEYSSDLFDAPTITRFLEHYLQLLEVLAKTPDIRLEDVTLQSASEVALIHSKAETTKVDANGKEFSQHFRERLGQSFDLPEPMHAVLLDEQMRLEPIGVPGQLWIGDRVVQSYAEATGARVYRTGLLGVYCEDGLIEVLGGEERIVNLRGRWLNLDTLAALINKIDDIERPVQVSAAPSGTTGYELAIYVEAGGEPEDIRRKIIDCLAAEYTDVLTAFGLCIREEASDGLTLPVEKALPIPQSLLSRRESPAEPQTPAEMMLSRIWTEVLDLTSVSINDNFFDLGGNSLNAFQVVNRIQEVFNLQIEILKHFELPTIKQLAAYVASIQEGKIPEEKMGLDEAKGLEVAAGQDDYFEASDGIPLSYGQKQMWFHYRLAPDSALYNVPVVVTWAESVDPKVIDTVLTQLVERHEMLRTNFSAEDGIPVQCVQPTPNVSAHVVQVAEACKNSSEWLKFAQDIVREESVKPFDLENGPGLRAVLLCFADTGAWLFLNMHHIRNDAWSHGILMREIIALYTSISRGNPAPTLPEISLQYSDFVSAQRKRLQGKRLKQLLTFWRDQLRDAPPLMTLPWKNARPIRQSHKGGMQAFALSEAQSTSLLNFCRRESVTVFMTLLAAFYVLLYRLSGQTDLLIGSPVANRLQPEFERVIGYFVNTLVFRAQIDPQVTFRELIEQIRAITLRAYDHQQLPLEVLIRELQPERSLSFHPLFQVMFSHQEVELPQQESAAELEKSQHYFLTGTSKFDLSLSVAESKDRIYGWLEYALDLFEPDVIKVMSREFKRVVEAITDTPELPLARWDLLEQSRSNLPTIGTRASRVRGYLVDPDQVLATLRHHAEVEDAAVEIVDLSETRREVVAWFRSTTAHEGITEEIATFLRRHLPHYMLPSAYVAVETWPKLSDGRTDYHALPIPVAKNMGLEHVYVSPTTQSEFALLEIWTDLLNVAGIGVQDNFFDLGGTSLIAVQMISRLRALFGVEVPVLDVFEFPTIRQLGDNLERITEGRGATNNHMPKPIPMVRSVSRDRPLPLSFAQERLWFLDQFEPGTPLYNVIAYIPFVGPFDTGCVKQALKDLTARHETLRTTFAYQNRQPVQIINAPWEVDVPVVDLRSEPISERAEKINSVVRQVFNQPFDLQIGPLFRSKVILSGADGFILIITMHHIISDAWSMSLLREELISRYKALLTGDRISLPSLPVQYADFAVWQRKWLKGDVLMKLVDFWQRTLADVPPLLELSISRARPPHQTFRGGAAQIELSAKLMKRLRALSRTENTTIFMTTLAAFNVLLGRYSARTDIVIGTPIANRSRIEIERLIGFFTNTLVVRTQLEGKASFRDTLQQVRRSVIAAQEHSELPFEKLVENLQPERSTSYNPIFQIMFSFQNGSAAGVELENHVALDDESQLACDVQHEISKFDLTLHAVENFDRITFVAEYNSDLFESDSIKRFLHHYVNLLSAVVTDADKPVSQVSFMGQDELELVTKKWNETSCVHRDPESLHRFVEDTAERLPDVLAVTYRNESLSYRQLNMISNRLARHLIDLGLEPGGRVAVSVGPSINLALVLLGVLKAGGVCVPLDKQYPAKRLTYMFADSGSSILIADQPPKFTIDDRQRKVLVLDEQFETRLELYAPENTRVEISGGSPAYVLYTSGSTGTPKAVVMPHSAISNLIHWQTRHSAGKALRTLQFSPVSFDVSFQEIFSTWASGGTLLMIDAEEKRDPRACLKFLDHHHIERLFLPFVALDQLASEVHISGLVPQDLREVITAGEQLRITPEIRDWFAKMKCCRLENQYGPVETHVATSYTLEGRSATWPDLPPIGKPIDNVKIHLLDAELQPVPVGVVGEICIGGMQLATGYLDRPEQTGERFIPSPFGVDASERIYRTGDIGLYREDGNIEFLGRMDGQVKLRGFRIEPGEIEAVLTTHPQIRESVVVIIGSTRASRRLVCYFVSENSQKDPAGIREYLSDRLPEYMVPSLFIPLPVLPLTPSGKVDRLELSKRSLPKLHLSGSDAPRTTLEEQLASIWMEVLGQQSIGINDNFFELGGHSLLATMLVGRISEEFGIRPSVKTLFAAPTITQLAKEVVVCQAESAEDISTILEELEQLADQESQEFILNPRETVLGPAIAGST